MKRFISAWVMALGLSLYTSAGLTFTGNTMAVLTPTPATDSGLNDLYVLYQTAGVRATYTAASSSASVKWYRYSNLGGGFAQEMTGVSHSGTQWTINLESGDMGYIIEEGDTRYYCWVTDYSTHPFEITGLAFGEEQECDVVNIIPSGKGDAIDYFGLDGRRFELSRRITLAYNSLIYEEDEDMYMFEPVEEIYASLPATIHARAPYCNTRFRLSGDAFLKEWGYEQTSTSETFTATAVEAVTFAKPQVREKSNEQKVTDGSMLGGSAPAVIDFIAYVTDAVVYKEWQFSKSPDFDAIDLRINELECSQTFTEQGVTYVRFVCANAEGSCDYYSETYKVFIGDSDLQCPNAFSPGASKGVNDEWKVSYKSIIEFECHIFNRYGTEMCSFTDPSKGWNGKYNGKLVPAGVYYYVIRARGADGKEYKLSGDINIVNYK